MPTVKTENLVKFGRVILEIRLYFTINSRDNTKYIQKHGIRKKFNLT